MNRLDVLVQEIKGHYKDLKQCQYGQIQKIHIGSLKLRCAEAKKILSYLQCNIDNNKLLKQIEQIEKKTNEILQKDNKPQKQTGFRYGFKQRLYQSSNQSEISNEKQKQTFTKVSRLIVLEEFRQTKIKVSQEQIDEIVKMMEKDQVIRHQIDTLMIQKSGDLTKIQEEIIKSYQNNGQQNKSNRIIQVRSALGTLFGRLNRAFLGFSSYILSFFKRDADNQF